MQTIAKNSRPTTKYYVGNIFDLTTSREQTLKQDYIYADGNLVAIHQTKQGVEKMLYVHLDNIGSVWAYTDDNGDIVEELNYDPWGRKRNPATWDYYTGYEHQTSSDRGFGGHEQIDIMDMVNMDGRMYDPYLGRFLSPDPYVQAPDNTQSLNRYAYCLNNPLSYTDPTGFSWIGNFFSAAIGIAVSIETGGFGGTIWGVMASAACGGASSAFASSMMNGANLWTATKSAFVGGCWGAVGGMANKAIGDVGKNLFVRIALHSVSDASLEALQGGHFEHGLLVGAVSAGGTEAISAYASNMSSASMIACEAALGGVVSELGGGKFANGAMTAAFQMMYNHIIHDRLSKHDRLFICSKEKYENWKERVRKKAFNFMINRSKRTNCEVAAVVLENGAILVFRDGENEEFFSKNYFIDISNDTKTYVNVNGHYEPVSFQVHTHPFIPGDPQDPIGIGGFDTEMANKRFNRIVHVLNVQDKLLYSVPTNHPTKYRTIPW